MARLCTGYSAVHRYSQAPPEGQEARWCSGGNMHLGSETTWGKLLNPCPPTPAPFLITEKGGWVTMLPTQTTCVTAQGEPGARRALHANGLRWHKTA